MGVNNEGESSKSSATLRSAGKVCFDWKSNCFLCGKCFTVNKKHCHKNKEIFKAGKTESIDTIKKKYKSKMTNGHLRFLSTCHSALIWLQVMERTKAMQDILSM